MEKKSGSNSFAVWTVIIVAVVLLFGVGYWYFTKDKTGTDNSDATSTSTTTVYTPKHEDWAVYKSSKYGFSISHPADYVLSETGDKSINISKGESIIVELYSSSGTAAEIDSAVALYTDASKGYMTGGQAQSVTIADTTGKKVTGTFGKNGGNRRVFEGKKGSVTIFSQGDRMYYLTSYDNGNAADLEIFNDIAADLVF